MSQVPKLFTLLCLIIAGTHGFPGRISEKKLFDENRDLRLCVTRQIELDKCNDLKQFFQNNKYQYKLECCLNTVDVCIEKVREGQCDFVVLEYQNEMMARNLGLRSYLYEEYSKKSYVVAVADQDVTVDDIKTKPLVFDTDDIRLVRAGLFFELIRQDKNICERVMPFQYDVLNKISTQNRKMNLNPMDIVRDEIFNYRNQEDLQNVQRDRNVQPIRFLRFNQLNEYDLKGKVLVCPNLEIRDLDSYEKCNFDTGSVRTIYGRDVDDDRLYFINYFKQIVKILTEKYRSQMVNQLKLFGEYRGLRNVIFDDDVVDFTVMRKVVNDLDDIKLNQLFCVSEENVRLQMLGIDANRDLNMVKDLTYQKMKMDTDRYREKMDEKRDQPVLDIYRQYLLVNPSRPVLTRQALFVGDRVPQAVNSQVYNQLLNERVRQLVNRDIDDSYLVRDPVLNVFRRNLLDNLYDPYRQFTDMDRSQRLSDANRFRQMLNLNRYQQYVSNPTTNRQYLNMDMQQEINRYPDVDRNRLLYDTVRNRQLLDDYFRDMDFVRQLEDMNRNRQILDDDQLIRMEKLNRLRNVDVPSAVMDRYRQLLDQDQFLKTQDSNRVRNNNPQMYDVQGDSQFLNELIRYRQPFDINRMRKMQSVNPLLDMNRYDELYDVNRDRQILKEDLMRQFEINNDINKRFRDTDRYFQMFDNDRFRDRLSNDMRETRDMERSRDMDFYKQMYDVDRNQMLDENQKRRIQTISQVPEDQSYQISNADRFREILRGDRYRQLSDEVNNEDYKNYIRSLKYLDEDRYRNDVKSMRRNRREREDRRSN